MTKTYAKIEDGHAVQVFLAEDRAALAQCANPSWFENQGGMDLWIEVPDGTLHGALDNGDGTFTNPPTQTVIAVRTRDQVRAAMKAVDPAKYFAAMTDPRLSYFLTRLAITENFHKDSTELSEGLDTLVALNLWSAQNKVDFLKAWS